MHWSETSQACPDDLCVHHLFERQVGRSPDAVAVEFEGQPLTYRDLDARANLLAAHLRAQGLARGNTVGLFLNRSLDMLISMLAVMKAGGAYVPLDPANPKSRLSLILADAECTLVLVHSQSAAGLPANSAIAVVVDEFLADVGSELLRSSMGTASVEVYPADLVYVVHTSGSTGTPKGVEIHHAAVVNLMRSMQKEPGISANDVLVAVTSLSFDIAALEFILPLTVGAKVVIASQDIVSDGAGLRALLESSGATIMQATPVTWRMLIDADWASPKRLRALCGGEALSRSLADGLLDRCAEVWNMYGPTETTIWSAVHRVQCDRGPVPIGKPIDNTLLYVLDDSLGPAPVGETGELYIGGAGLARGYRAREDLTRLSFIPNPFAPGKMYKTGDLARRLPDGTIECLGRLDHQVKIRGHRVELGEVEHALHQAASVKDAVVMAYTDPKGEKHLVAYVVCKPGQPCMEVDLRAICDQMLPSYMAPSFYVFVASFLLTPNGKVDRNALPLPEIEKTSAACLVEQMPADTVEEKVAELWRQLLGVKVVGRDDNFMSMGGNSITMTWLSNRISEVFDVQLPVTTLYRRRTVAQMAEAIHERLRRV